MHLNMCMHTNKYTAIKLCNHYFASFFVCVCVIHMCICIEKRLYVRQIYDYIIILLYINIYIYTYTNL